MTNCMDQVSYLRTPDLINFTGSYICSDRWRQEAEWKRGQLHGKATIYYTKLANKKVNKTFNRLYTRNIVKKSKEINKDFKTRHQDYYKMRKANKALAIDHEDFI